MLAPEQIIQAPGGWSLRINKGPILGTDDHYLWKRELNCFQSQHLPEALFGRNSLEIIHADTGLRLHFNALEALRCWSALDLPPVRVPSANTGSWKQFTTVDWDYTFTNAYQGSMDVIDTDCLHDEEPQHQTRLQKPRCTVPDSSSFVSREAVDLASGKAQLRKPLCKCKGEGGRPAFFKVTRSHESKRMRELSGKHFAGPLRLQI